MLALLGSFFCDLSDCGALDVQTELAQLFSFHSERSNQIHSVLTHKYSLKGNLAVAATPGVRAVYL